MQEGVKKVHSESSSSISLPIQKSAHSDAYINPGVIFDNITYFQALLRADGFKDLERIDKYINCDCHTNVMKTGKKNVMNCYNS